MKKILSRGHGGTGKRKIFYHELSRTSTNGREEFTTELHGGNSRSNTEVRREELGIKKEERREKKGKSQRITRMDTNLDLN